MFEPREVSDAADLIRHKPKTAEADFLETHPGKEGVFNLVSRALDCLKESPRLSEAKKTFFDGFRGQLQGSEVGEASKIFDGVYEKVNSEAPKPKPEIIQHVKEKTVEPANAAAAASSEAKTLKFDGRLVGEVADALLKSPSTARGDYLKQNIGQETLFDAVDAAVDYSLASDSKKQAREAFTTHMRENQVGGDVEKVFESVYDKVAKENSGGSPQDAVPFDGEQISKSLNRGADWLRGKYLKGKGWAEDSIKKLAGGSFSRSSKELERLMEDEVIPKIEEDNLNVARRALEVSGGWEAVQEKAGARLKREIGAREYGNLKASEKEELLREPLVDELESRGFRILVKDHPKIKWAGSQRMGPYLGWYSSRENTIEVNRGRYFDAAGNPEKMNELVGVISHGTVGHEVYHSQQRDFAVGDVYYNGMREARIFDYSDAEQRSHLWGLWSPLIEGSATYMTSEPQTIQKLLDVEEKILSHKPLSPDEQAAAQDMLYSPYSFGALTIANIREQVKVHYIGQGRSPAEAEALAEQTARDYMQMISPGLEKNMVEGLSAAEVAQMTNMRDAMFGDYATARERMGKPYLTAEAIIEAVPGAEGDILSNELELRQAELWHAGTVVRELERKAAEREAVFEDAGSIRDKIGQLEGKTKEIAEKNRQAYVNHQNWLKRQIKPGEELIELEPVDEELELEELTEDDLLEEVTEDDSKG